MKMYNVALTYLITLECDDDLEDWEEIACKAAAQIIPKYFADAEVEEVNE